jgi:uncharacterized protein (TIGR00266 family)
MQVDIKGSTMPLLEMTLDPGESVVSTHGDLSWMSTNVKLTQAMSTGGQKGLMSGLKRAMGGGGVFLTTYEAEGGPGLLAFAAKLPGRIFEIAIEPGQGYLVHRHGWLCGTDGVVPSVGLQQTIRGGLDGGDGFLLQRLDGQGRAWIELGGEITTYELAAGQSMLVHPGHVGLFQESVSFTIVRMQGIKNIAFSGDGYHLVNLTGPGTIYLQSMPIPVLAQALSPYLDRGGDNHPAADAGVGGLIGGIIGKNL